MIEKCKDRCSINDRYVDRHIGDLCHWIVVTVKCPVIGSEGLKIHVKFWMVKKGEKYYENFFF